MSRGFSMLELIVVMLILAVISVMAAQSYLRLLGKARDQGLRAAVGTIRAAVAIHYARSAARGQPKYPSITPVLFLGKYVPDDIYTPTSNVKTVTNIPIQPEDFDDNGGWVYNPVTGEVRVDLPGKHNY